MKNINTVKEAIDFEVDGLNKVLSEKQIDEYKGLPVVIDRLKLVKNGSVNSCYYLNALPIDSVRTILVGKTFTNNYGYRCTIDEADRIRTKFGKVKIVLGVSTPDSKNTKKWDMFLNTLLSEGHKIEGVPEMYTSLVTKYNVDSYLTRLNSKLDKYNKLHEELKLQQVHTINTKVNSFNNNAVITREAIHKAKADIRKDATFIQDAWNSTLTEEEKKKLISWINKNVYSMRLYVLKDGAYDQAITELFPDEKFGKKRRTEASELSHDSIGGYISFNSIKDAPMDIITKVTKKVKSKDNFKLNKGSTKYRLNNYMFVLYMLQNYNDKGFVTGKTNLNKVVK